jgi:hypothetical protein
MNRRRECGIRWMAFALLGLACCVADAHSQTTPPPQFIYGTRKGLDVQHNDIDRLINTFGFICLRSRFNPKPCRIETEILAFLMRLIPTKLAVARELTVLGADCIDERAQLKCTYERHVESAAWTVGASEPVAVTDNLFRIIVRVIGEDGLLHFETSFDRVTKPRELPNK